MSGSEERIYRVRSAPSLHWAVWSDEYVVFDEGSGQTHQLDAIRAFVLHLLIEGPHLLGDVAEALGASSAFSKGEEGDAILTAIFNEFQTCGLVEVMTQ